MKIAVIVVRVLMSLMFIMSVVNFFFPFMPQPTLGEAAQKFVFGLAASSYFFPLLKITELLCALALLTGRFVALALVILFPITLNIFFFHAFLESENMVVPVLLLAGHLFLAYNYRERYSTMLAFR